MANQTVEIKNYKKNARKLGVYHRYTIIMGEKKGSETKEKGFTKKKKQKKRERQNMV